MSDHFSKFTAVCLYMNVSAFICWYLAWLLFGHEDGDSTLLRNVVRLVPAYKALRPRS